MASRSIDNWHVSDEVSLSDHRYICFKYRTNQARPIIRRRNPKNTNWINYKRDLKIYLGDPKYRLDSTIDIEFEADRLVNSLLQAWTDNCPEKEVKPKKVPWWNKELEALRRETRTAFNRAKAQRNFSEYSKKLAEYNKAIRKSKRKSWNAHCDQINSLPEGMRLAKALSMVKESPLTSVRNKDGQLTESGKETLQTMTNEHFPGCLIVNDKPDDDHINNETLLKRTSRAEWNAAKKVVDGNSLKWAIESFKPYKTPGPDGIYPALLQHGMPVLIPHLIKIYRACIAFGHVPKTWTNVKVVYLPKAGKANYQDVRSYRPISLTSFLLKTMEKLIDRHIREGPLQKNPLHVKQCAYQQGKSTETALHLVVKRAEAALESKEICVAAFIDIEGAFDRTTFEAIQNAAVKHGVEPTICRWIQQMLKSRIISSTLSGETIYARTTRGCPQGGVLSPLLWCLVVNSLMMELNMGPFYTVGYADDLVIMVNGKFPNTVSELLQKALNIAARWSRENHLSINPSKTTALYFTRKRDLKSLKRLKLAGEELQWSSQVKYLGVILDKALTWKAHQEHVISKSMRIFAMCRRAYGKTWGLKPKILYWIYSTMILPIIKYGSIAWWPRTTTVTCRKSLSTIQRIACMCITGAFRTTPTAAMEMLLNLTPLHIVVQMEAVKSIKRLIDANPDSYAMMRHKITKLPIEPHIRDMLEMKSDKIRTKLAIHKNFKMVIPTREEWNQGLARQDNNRQIWYTDGSKMASGTGAGVYTENCSISTSMGKYATVFQAEVYAIIECTQEIINKKISNKEIYILSDSQAALKALSSFKVNSGLVLNCIKNLNKIGRSNKIRLIWVPGHAGIHGNEKADELARKGSETSLLGPEPFIGLGETNVKTAINKNAKDKHLKEWKSTPGLTHSKTFIKNVTKSMSDKIKNLSKDSIRKITGAFTGHYGTNYILNKIGAKDDPKCRHCQEDVETMRHLLCECDALGRKRMDLLGNGYPKPEDYKLMSLGGIAKFLNFAIPPND